MKPPVEDELRPALGEADAERMLRTFRVRRDATLRVPVEEELRPALSGGDAERMLRSQRLRRRLAEDRRSRRRWQGAGALAALAAAALLGWLAWPAPGALRLADGGALPEVVPAAELTRLSDGSAIATEPGTRLRRAENDGAQLRTVLGAGEATFDVVPGGPRRWIVDAGDARVTVLGTRFSVRHEPPAVEVRVARGRVEVRHPELPRPRLLEAGESVSVGARTIVRSPDPPARSVAPEPSEAAENPEPVPLPERAPVARREHPAPREAPVPSWRARALEGDYAGAYALLGAEGLATEARRVSPADQLLLADVARGSGRPREAVPVLEALVARGGERAPVAAFMLGRLWLDALGRPRDAAASFARVASQPDAGNLASEALALEAQAWARAGEASRARDAASRYLERHPEGRRAERMRRLAGR